MRVSDIVLRAVVCGACLAGCDDSGDTSERSDPEADFASYKTFSLASAPTSGAQSIPGEERSNLKVIEDALKKNLESLGLREDTSGNPDVIAFSLISTKAQTGLSWSCLPDSWYGNWNWSFDPCELMSSLYPEYEEGTFAVGLVDPKRGKVVFSGVGEEALVGDENDIQRDVEGDVNEIFKGYPSDQSGS